MKDDRNKSALKIGKLKVDVPLALAPMVGLSHSAMRSLLLEAGGVGLLFTEMLAAKRLPYDNADLSPMLVRTEQERPLIYQIFLANEEPVRDAAKKLEKMGADGIDINLGCPAPQLRRRGAGGFLAEDTGGVRKIVKNLRRETALPISAKIRLGRELDKSKLIGFCKMLEGEGIDFLSVHGRLHGEKFCRHPRWDWIGYVKEHVQIPVIANGGIFSVEDAKTCIERSGADGLMIGRGGMERPWIFGEIANEVYGKNIVNPFGTLPQLFFRFVELLEDRFKVERRLGRLKQFTHYFALNFTFGHHLASSVQRSKNMEDAVKKAMAFFEKTNEQELIL